MSTHFIEPGQGRTTDKITWNSTENKDLKQIFK